MVNCGRLTGVLFAAVVLAAWAGLGCNRSSSNTIPESLVGIWTTPDTRYAGRFVELGSHSVTFGLGTEGRAVHAVSSIEWTNDYGHSLFTVHYEGEDGDERSMSFYHAPFDGILVFKNQLQTHWFRKQT